MASLDIRPGTHVPALSSRTNWKCRTVALKVTSTPKATSATPDHSDSPVDCTGTCVALERNSRRNKPKARNRKADSH